MNPFAGCDLKHEEGNKDQSQEQERIFEASVDRLVGICHLDERNTKSSCGQPRDRINLSYRPRTRGSERERALGAGAVPGYGPAYRQESSIEPRVGPISP